MIYAVNPPGVASPERWRALNDDLRIAGDERMYRRLVKAWSARGRHYHSIAHLDACLREFDIVRTQAIHPAEVEMALWFHDAVYKSYSKHNEERSAEWAVEYLTRQAAPHDAIGRIRDYVLATKHAAGDLTDDTALVVGIDLAILGQAPAIYEQFESNVRKEYWWVSRRRYIKARTAVLGSFLNRPRIYDSDALSGRYEAPARENLRRAIEKLQAR